MLGKASFAVLFSALILLEGAVSQERQKTPSASGLRKSCRKVVLEGEVHAGEPYSRAIGNGLQFALQPIHSGWIIRVLPLAPFKADYDYAELATPPYQSVTPLSVSTDFGFRAQDAVAWNPRRFRYATSPVAFARLEQAYLRFEHAGANPSATLQVALSEEIAHAAEGRFTILDARLVPGTADQWKAAAAVASHFDTTAHTVLAPPDGKPSHLGQIADLRFRVELAVPPGFVSAPGTPVQTGVCLAGEANLQ